MIEALLGGLLGGAFRLAPELLKWLDRKGERGHELAMQDKTTGQSFCTPERHPPGWRTGMCAMTRRSNSRSYAVRSACTKSVPVRMRRGTLAQPRCGAASDVDPEATHQSAGLVERSP
jgi:hypothetical protein